MLLVLFWLGWVGMLAGAIVIIVKAPHCKPIPEMNWWNEGPLYQISDFVAFSGGLAGRVLNITFIPDKLFILRMTPYLVNLHLCCCGPFVEISM